MNAIEFIKAALETSKSLTVSLIEDMKDAPLTQPTENGGNHPTWILGHLAYSESSMLHNIILGDENPLAHWKELFGGGSEPVNDASAYPTLDELAKKYDGVRQETLRFISQLTEADLDNDCKGCPPERKSVFGTVGKCLMMMSLHPPMHRGQVADARRMLKREPLLA